MTFPIGWLKARPVTTLCIECKTSQEEAEVSPLSALPISRVFPCPHGFARYGGSLLLVFEGFSRVIVRGLNDRPLRDSLGKRQIGFVFRNGAFGIGVRDSFGQIKSGRLRSWAHQHGLPKDASAFCFSPNLLYT